MTRIDASTRGVVHYRAMLENEMIGGWDLTKDGKPIRATVVIKSVEQYVPPRRLKKKMPDGSFAPERLNKLVIEFERTRKKWICGPVNQATIKGIYGTNVVAWIGKKITLVFDPDVKMGKKVTGGIRVVNTAPTEAPTEDPLDEPVDAERSAMLAETFGVDEETTGREPGED